MLTYEDNEALVRVGSGTAMGNLFRLYWIPFLPSRDLEIDGQPQRIKLLGEDLVAFRDSAGKVGLVDHACPHRGAPMMLGRNEGCGLRCVYHGWKFDISGNVLDMPVEPEDSRFKNKVKIKSYPCQERNGMVWTFMGADADAAPPLPNLEWNLVPEENVVVTFRVQECNWLQALEGEIDSAHAPILHGRVDTGGSIDKWVATRDLRPTFECANQDFGVSIASRRVFDEDTLYWRVNQFLMPFYTLVPPQSNYPELSGHAWVPIDDENTLCIMFSYHPSQPMYEKSRKLFTEGHNGRETGHASRNAYKQLSPMTPYAKYRTRYNFDNGYGFDYESQQKTWFSGLPGLWVQDAACQSGVSPIYDRSKEHLGLSDTGITKTRRFLLEKLRAYRDRGAKPKRMADPDLYLVRAISIKLDKNASWIDEGGPFMQARLGEDFGYKI
ncbi:Rieske 2Fe-2S domain-containing protein [Sneathiella sp.]|uniref:Rieske 2Fe-2S domain-containing protein n=1 Tax=Sneathiella sp. TaxID=1964365 RepID=UPI00261E5836|nr:Rieske 2Fe-2S domain-containing protein [Sneathiella sp.]MDF2367131.1 Rieske 2Fe-2S domain-containing protein [Sneathiella sp.]